MLATGSHEPGPIGREVARPARSGRVSVLLSFMTRMELLYGIAANVGQHQAESAVRLLDAAGGPRPQGPRVRTSPEGAPRASASLISIAGPHALLAGDAISLAVRSAGSEEARP